MHFNRPKKDFTLMHWSVHQLEKFVVTGGKPLFGEVNISGGQLLGQKNTAMGIWMSNTYLQPLSSVFLAFYIIWQNLFNSLQLWWHDRKVKS